jgi:predicted NAD-dependent protein-ADP-ribosyltransferase YbiA (DUF1768 family)
MTILFYRAQDPHGHYSNFSRHPVFYMGVEWRTSEHAFQAMKFWPHCPRLVDEVRNAVSPAKAAVIGRERSNPIRPDWDSFPSPEIKARIDTKGKPFPVWIDDEREVTPPPEKIFQRTKDVFMYEIVWAKFDQHRRLAAALMSNSEPLIEDAIHDPYWGWGCSKVGHNKLGRILMLVRTSFRKDIYIPIGK